MVTDKYGDPVKSGDQILISYEVSKGYVQQYLYNVLDFDKAIPDKNNDPCRLLNPLDLKNIKSETITKL